LPDFISQHIQLAGQLRERRGAVVSEPIRDDPQVQQALAERATRRLTGG
jgi:hypothetical protein